MSWIWTLALCLVAPAGVHRERPDHAKTNSSIGYVPQQGPYLYVHMFTISADQVKFFEGALFPGNDEKEALKV